MKHALFFLCLLGCAPSMAEPLQTIYYANGARAIEGHWRYHVNNVLPVGVTNDNSHNSYAPFRDVLPLIGEGERYQPDWFLPSLQCEGAVTTWYADGKKRSDITFVAGVPSGPYARYHPGGQRAMAGRLTDGMPDGLWKAYYPNGKPFFTGVFRPYTQEELGHRWQNRMIAGDYSSSVFTHEPKPEDEEVLDPAETKEVYYSGGERVGYPSYAVRAAFNRFNVGSVSKKDGDFVFYREDGTKQAELSFSNNVRHGFWKLWDNQPAPILVLEYDHGRLLGITDSNGRKTPAAYARWWHANRAKLQSSEIVEGPAVATVYQFVSQEPQFNGDIATYIQQQMKLSPKVQRKSLGKAAVAEFNIEADGRVGDAVMTKSIGPAFDAELLRVIRLMPAWRPVKADGRAVRTRYRLDFYYGLLIKAGTAM